MESTQQSSESDPKTSEPDLCSVDMSGVGSVPCSSAISIVTGSADSDPVGLAWEYRQEPNGIVRWLERKSWNRPTNVPFDDVHIREHEGGQLSISPQWS